MGPRLENCKPRSPTQYPPASHPEADPHCLHPWVLALGCPDFQNPSPQFSAAARRPFGLSLPDRPEALRAPRISHSLGSPLDIVVVTRCFPNRPGKRPAAYAALPGRFRTFPCPLLLEAPSLPGPFSCSPPGLASGHPKITSGRPFSTPRLLSEIQVSAELTPRPLQRPTAWEQGWGKFSSGLKPRLARLLQCPSCLASKNYKGILFLVKSPVLSSYISFGDYLT
ncbi:uncharacterized protein LOC115802110 [Delphinapterus leucas]|uniref:Uncharacterized protein LOC115802110 n=1 Tax=Delphinapterus leucas TaxID=9749 RepID=A0A7F8K809_DELLE|nr:uncharacterized protein LOC115802110 [Delphinapterus leucas]